MAFVERRLNIFDSNRQLKIVLMLVAGWMLIYVGLGRLTEGAVSHYYYRRLDAIFHVIHRMPVENRDVVFIGPSDVALNVSPRQIESLVAEVKVYNYGVLIAGPDVMRLVAQELSETALRAQKKLGLVVLRFMPMMYTKNYRVKVRDSHFALFTYDLPFHHLLSLSLREGPEFLARSVYLRLVHDGGGQGSWQWPTVSFLASEIQPKVSSLEEAKAIYERIWAPPVVAPLENYWDEKREGEIDVFGVGDMKQLIDSDRDGIYEVGFRHHHFLFDPLSLDFDDAFFRDLDESIALLNRVAKKVAIFYLPDSLPPYAEVSEDGKRRLKEKIEQLKNDRRVEFWDYSDIGIMAHDFLDISHLMPEGKAKLNAKLAESIGKAL